MGRLVLALALGLFGAGIVHIAILLLLPHYTERDAWTQLSDVSEYYATTRIGGSAGTAPLLRSLDPLFGAVACRFSLSDGPLHVRAPGKVPFWSMSVYDRNGQNVFSFNDRTAADGKVDFMVLTAAQTVQIRRAHPERFMDAVFIEAELAEGIVMVRAFVPDPSWNDTVDAFLRGVVCTAEG